MPVLTANHLLTHSLFAFVFLRVPSCPSCLRGETEVFPCTPIFHPDQNFVQSSFTLNDEPIASHCSNRRGQRQASPGRRHDRSGDVRCRTHRQDPRRQSGGATRGQTQVRGGCERCCGGRGGARPPRGRAGGRRRGGGVGCRERGRGLLHRRARPPAPSPRPR